MRRDVAVCIPTFPARAELLRRAVNSVLAQTHPASEIHVASDVACLGSGPTRTRAMKAATATWVAFLDDDDVFLPHHLARCLAAAEQSGADVIVPWFDVVGGLDPFPRHRGRQVNPDDLHSFPITCLVRREAIGDLTFETHDSNATGAADDYKFWLALCRSGVSFHAIPDTTWHWHHNNALSNGKAMPNTSGIPARRLALYGS